MLASLFADRHSNDSFFMEADPTHLYNPTHTNRILRDALAQQGIEVHTADLNVGRQVDLEIHVEGRALQPSTVPRYLIALENPFINTFNADASYMANFRRVFGWDPRFHHLPNAVPIHYGIHFVVPKWPDYAHRDIFSCLINANKRFLIDPPKDLYMERVSVIRWHERHAPRDFALFGMGWSKPHHESGFLGKARRRVQRLATQLFGSPPFPSWQGAVPDKSTVLLRSKFAYCYENVADLTGYVTEKIFDALMCGCVPVYWGADDIDRHVPPECFVDRRKFADTAAVHAHLRAMTPEHYAGMQQAIREFVDGEGVRRFGAASFARTVAEGIGADLRGKT